MTDFKRIVKTAMGDVPVKRLALLRSMCDWDQALGILRAEGITDGLLVLAESAEDLPRLRSAGFSAACIDDFFIRCNPGEEEVYRLARTLERRIEEFTSHSPDKASFCFHGISLLPIVRYHLEFKVLAPIIKILDILRQFADADAPPAIQVLQMEVRTLSFLRKPILAVPESPGATVRSVLLKPSLSQLNWRGRLAEWLERNFGVLQSILHLRATYKQLQASRKPSRPDPPPGAALFCLERPGVHLDTCLRVLEASRGQFPMIAAPAETMAQSEVLPESATLIEWLSLLKASDAIGISLKSHAIRRALRRLGEDRVFRERLTDKECCLWPWLSRELSVLSIRIFPLVMAMIASMKRLFQSQPPAVVVTSAQHAFFPRICMELGRRFAIPSLSVEAFLIEDHPAHYYMDTDWAAVLDRETAKMYQEHVGISPSRLAVTGLPRFDDIARILRETDGADARRKYNIAPGDKLLIFATQPISLNHLRRMLQAIGAALAGHPDRRLVIKVHPREEMTKYQNLVEELGLAPINPVVTASDLYPLLVGCNLLVTGFSNVAYEAAIADKAVLTVNLTGNPDIFPFAENGIALSARGDREITELVEKLLFDDATIENLARSRREYFAQNPQAGEGRAAGRVVDLISEIAGTAGQNHNG